MVVSHIVTSLKSLEVNPCNLNGWEHGSWCRPLHMGSQVLSPKHDNTFWRWGLQLVLRVGSSKNRDQTQLMRTFLKEIVQIPHSMIINHILMVAWGSNVGTFTSILGLANMSGTWHLGSILASGTWKVRKKWSRKNRSIGKL